MTRKLVCMVTQRLPGELATTRRAGAALVLVSSSGVGIAERPVRWRDRLLRWLRAPSLDRRLCRGEPAETSVVLALHATRLAQPNVRGELDRALRRVMWMAERAPSTTTGRVRVCRPQVRDAHRELRNLCDRLVGSGPVSARGVAQVRVLLADGAGPLYRRTSSDDLRARLRGALAAMDTLGPPPPTDA